MDVRMFVQKYRQYVIINISDNYTEYMTKNDGIIGMMEARE